MDQGSRKKPGTHEEKPVSLGELIHERVRGAIERAVEEELAAALGAAVYERTDARRGYRNGQKARTLTGPTGPLALTLPRGVVFAAAGGGTEWACPALVARAWNWICRRLTVQISRW
jgi:Transposase, Mutator family